MTVIVKLSSGAVDKYMRFGDSYAEHSDGTLDVVRRGAKEPHRYAAGEWSGVHGDQNHGWKVRR